MKLNSTASWIPFWSQLTGAKTSPEVNAAFDGLCRALEQSLAGGSLSSHDLGLAVSNAAWQALPSLAARLPPEQRAAFAQYRTEVRNLLHDLRDPTRPPAPPLRQQQLATALALYKQWDTWQDLAATTAPVSPPLQVWWDRLKSWSLAAGSIYGLVWYFFLRAVGDLQVDVAHILSPASAEVLFETAAGPSQQAALEERRRQYLRDYRDLFLGKGPFGRQSSPLLPQLGQSLGGPFNETRDGLEQRLNAEMTATQQVYDLLGQLPTANTLSFAVHISNHSPRGARPVGEVRTRLTYLEPLEFPWQELDVAADLRCVLTDGALWLQPTPPAPAVNVQVTQQTASGEHVSILNQRLVWQHDLNLESASEGRLQVVRFRDDGQLIGPQFLLEVTRSSHEIPPSEIAPSREAALSQKKLYFFHEPRPSRPGVINPQPRLMFALPSDRRDLDQLGTVTDTLEIDLRWEDLQGRQSNRRERVKAPPDMAFFQPRFPFVADQLDELLISPDSTDRPRPNPPAPAMTGSRSSNAVITAAADTLDRSGPTNAKEFLLNRVLFSGPGLTRGNTLEHITHLDAQLAPGGKLLVAGRMEACPSGRYQLEIWLDNQPLEIEPSKLSSKTAKIFVNLPLQQFDPYRLADILPRFRSPTPKSP